MTCLRKITNIVTESEKYYPLIILTPGFLSQIYSSFFAKITFSFINRMNSKNLRSIALDLINNTFLEKPLRAAFQLLPTDSAKADRLTNQIIKNYLTENMNCIDVGCYRGEIMDLFLKYAPWGNHVAFEPSQINYNFLSDKYAENSKVTIAHAAVGEDAGEVTFNFIPDRPARSSMKINQGSEEYAAEVQKVRLCALDQEVQTKPISLIKIDVEGAELGVLKGAREIILRDRPLLIFECDRMMASEFSTTAKDIYDLLSSEYSCSVNTITRFAKQKKSLSYEEFKGIFDQRSEIYWVAIPE